jgi:mycothiol synthase
MGTPLVRRLSAADAEAFTAAVSRARDAGDLLGSSAPHGEWVVSFALDAPGESAVAELDGALVGFVLPEVKTVVLDPGHRRRGIGRALVGAGLEIERERERPDLILGVRPGDVAGEAFLRATGFAFHSTLWDLDLAPGRAVPPAAWPDGLVPRASDEPLNVAALVDLFNAAFADHATPLQLSVSPDLETWLGAAARAGDLIVVMGPDGQPVGFCSTEPTRDPAGVVQARGEIWTIGVRPDLQGRGLGRQLLRAGVTHLRAVGVETVSLAVNGRNPRALGLYESEGFVRTATRDRWARSVATAAG